MRGSVSGLVRGKRVLESVGDGVRKERLRDVRFQMMDG